MIEKSLLTKDDRELLFKVKEQLEGITETLEILEDDDTVNSIKEAEKDVKKGRKRDYKEFIEELKNSGNVNFY